MSYFELLAAAAFRWFAEEAVERGGRRGRAARPVGRHQRRRRRRRGAHQRRPRPHRRRGGLAPAHGRGEGRHHEARRPRSCSGPPIPTWSTSSPTARPSVTWRRDEDFACTANRLALGGRVLDLRTPGGTYEDVFLPLHGAHQGDNAGDRAGRRRGLLRPAARSGGGGRGVRRRALARPLRGRRARPPRDPRRRPQPRRVPRRPRPPSTRGSPRSGCAGWWWGCWPAVIPTSCSPSSRWTRLTKWCAAPRIRRGPSPRSSGRGRHRARGSGPCRRRRSRQRCRPRSRASEADDVVLVTGSLYTVGAARTACRSDRWSDRPRLISPAGRCRVASAP